MSSLYSDFKDYAIFGVVPTIQVTSCISGCSKSYNCYNSDHYSINNKILQNSFYKSLYLINIVIGPVRNVLFGDRRSNAILPSVTSIVTFALANVVLQPLYLMLAYLLYWPAKGLAKLTYPGPHFCSTKSLTDYSSMLFNKAWDHSLKIADFVNTILSYAVSAIIRAAALVIYYTISLGY